MGKDADSSFLNSLHEVLSELKDEKGLPYPHGIFLPHVMNGYKTAPLKIFYYGLDTRTWMGDDAPIGAQGVAFDDIRVGFEGEEVEVGVDNLNGLGHHLALGNPECSLSHADSEVVYFNPVKLADGDLNHIIAIHRTEGLPTDLSSTT